MEERYPDLPAVRRVLLGPGPSDVAPRVMRAMATPVLGHLDPEFLAVMDRIQAMLREIFRTRNAMTFVAPGTGMAGMECALVNVVEPGDRVLVGVAGVFAGRMADVAARIGAEVHKVEAPWGQVVPDEPMIEAIRTMRPKVVGLVHGETSTGIQQPIAPIAAAARAAGALVVVDTVASLTGVPFDTDGLGADIVYTGSQKCLSCPPGLAPITFSERAVAAARAKQAPCRSFYLDIALLERYWGSERVYHHTAAASLYYGLYEGLRAVLEEGLEARCERHLLHHRALVAGLAALGLDLASDPAHRLPVVNAVRVPAGVDAHRVRRRLLHEHDIEVGAGLGPFKDTVWRVGLMGSSATANNVMLLLAALESILRDEGAAIGSGGAAAAGAVYR